MSVDFQSTLVIIPARGGSKRIPNKNLKMIFGQPMICWPLMTINRLFDAANVLVSTDSDLIKAEVETRGLIVPFKRPAALADDFTGTAEVVTHALQWFEENIRKVDYVLTVYPTAVLLCENDIVAAMDLLKQDKSTDSVMSATNFPFPIQRAIFKNSMGYAEMFYPENYYARSQDLEEAMHDAGQFYLSKADSVRQGAVLTNSRVKIQALKRNRVVDIDTLEDFELAEEKLRLYRKGEVELSWKFSE
jgi:N-acylneuraminate cytidylyltransferase